MLNNNDEIMVSILMPAYNHEKYISQAIDSALTQKTSFKFEVLIHDDCSKDSTLKLALQYAQKFSDKIHLFTEKENQGLIKSYKKLINVAKGKYLAILESDDFWLDENKLQEQVDFLESNPDYGLCSGDIIEVDEYGNQINKKRTYNKHIRDKTRWYEELLGNRGVHGACTCIFRKSDFDKYCSIDEFVSNNFLTFDQPAFLSIAFNTKCKYFQKCLAAYRVLKTSVSNNSDRKKNMSFYLSIAKIEEYIISRFGTGNITELCYNHKICGSILGKALKLHQIKPFVKYARKMIPQNFKQQVMHIFPHLYYFQFIVRHR